MSLVFARFFTDFSPGNELWEEQTASVCLEQGKCTIAELYSPSTRENGRTMSYTRLVTRE